MGKRDLKIRRAVGEPTRKKQRNENNEESYEAFPREAKWMNDEEVEYLLPIKSGDGVIHQVKKKKDIVDNDDIGKLFLYFYYSMCLVPFR